ncbi:MAG TPA: hypothetical protein PK833_09120, partial [Vicingus sp.]|nr:hypothetical protein [Vicingus sp.]
MIKNNFHILLSLTFSLIGLHSSFAQKLDTTTIVTVKPYDPVLSDAFKLKDNPSIQDTDKVIPTLNYTFINKQVPVDFVVEPILPAKIKGEP